MEIYSDFTESKKKYAQAVYVVLLAIIIIVVPLLLIWSLNTLLRLGIRYEVWTWLAAAILFLLFASDRIMPHIGRLASKKVWRISFGKTE